MSSSGAARARAAFVFLTGAAFLGVLTQTASALVGLVFEPAVAEPGVRVTATTEGPVLAQDPEGYELYLAPSQRVADSVTGAGGPPNERRLTPIGRLLPDSRGVGRITFTVPDVAPGTYVAVAYCEGCGGEGSTFSAVGELKIGATGTLPTTGAPLAAAISVAAALVVLGIAASIAPRR